MILDELVREFLIEKGDSNFNQYARHLQFAISGLREMNIDTSGVPTTVILNINDNHTVNLPNDFLNYTRIGILGFNGQIADLGINQNLLGLIASDNCGNPQVPTGRSQANTMITDSGFGIGDTFGDNYRNGELMGRFFGIGGGNNSNGYYNIKRGDNVLILSTTVAHQIILEYIADIKKVDGNFNVHPFLIEALKFYMYWKSIKMNDSKGLGEKQMAKKDYDVAYQQSKRRFNSATMNEWRQTFLSGNIGTARM
jgi:hypothetical protein